jgi:WD40 repeat protein
MPRRPRGVFLTDRGLERLEIAIAAAQEAEKYGKRFTQDELKDRAGINPKTIKKIRQCSKVADKESVAALFRGFGLTLETADYWQPDPTTPATEFQPAPQQQPRVDLLEAPDASVFYGREAELLLLQQWVLADRCRLIALLGMGGMGKTALSVRLLEAVQGEFEYVIFCSLREAPPVETILEYVIRFLSNQQELYLPATLGDAVTRLVHYLAQARCLLVLDNAESILAEGTRAGLYREGYEGYGTLIQRLGEARHQSCVLLTSREKPGEVARLEGCNRPVRSYSLQGLEAFAGQEFLKAEGLNEQDAQWQQVFDYYSGNPLALKIAANTIQDLFGGNTHQFLAQDAGVFGDIRDLLAQQFDRLTALGQSVMYWLVINREATSIKELQADLFEPISSQDLLEVLQSLQRRSLVERASEGFTLQNVVMEYLTDLFISEISEEVLSQNFDRFHTHALIKATVKDYVREAQVRLILKPIEARTNDLDQIVLTSLETIRKDSGLAKGYAAGNLLNLFCQSQIASNDIDFSNQTLRHAYLRGVEIHRLNLANSIFVNPSIAQDFGSIHSITFSPDGTLLAAGDGSGNIHLWRVSNWQYLFSFKGPTISWLKSISFSPDNQFIASASGDSKIRIWDVQSRRCVATLLGHSGWLNSLSFSPDGQVIASGGVDSKIRVWDISKQEFLDVDMSHPAWVSSLDFSSDGRFIVSGCGDSKIRIWDLHSYQCICVMSGHNGAINSVSFSPNNQLVASGSKDSNIRLWDVKSQKCIHVFRGHSHWINSINFNHDGQLITSGSMDSTIRIWDVYKRQCVSIFTENSDWVYSTAFSPDNKLVAGGCSDSTLRIWDVRKQKCLHTFIGHSNGVQSIAFDPKSQFIVSGCGDSKIRILDFQKHRFNCNTLQGHSGWINSISISSDGQLVASGSADFSVRIWSFSNQKCLHVFTGHTDRVQSVSFSPDSRFVASGGGGDYMIRVWEISKRQCCRTLKGHSGWVNSVVFSPDCQFIASGAGDFSVRLWDFHQQRLVHKFTGNCNVNSVSFDPESRFVASGCSDSSIRIWDIQNQSEAYCFSGHSGWISSVSFSPDGRFIASGSSDSTVRLWNFVRKQCIHVFRGHNTRVRSVAFSPDGCLLASSSPDGIIRIWDIQTGKCIKVLQIPRPYEGSNITGAKGLTETQRASMLALGAIDRASDTHPAN